MGAMHSACGCKNTANAAAPEPFYPQRDMPFLPRPDAVPAAPIPLGIGTALGRRFWLTLARCHPFTCEKNPCTNSVNRICCSWAM
jgi:hypothetical protein